jgi:hypothetical protein
LKHTFLDIQYHAPSRDIFIKLLRKEKLHKLKEFFIMKENDFPIRESIGT